jgi:hypothetical protein
MFPFGECLLSAVMTGDPGAAEWPVDGQLQPGLRASPEEPLKTG